MCVREVWGVASNKPQQKDTSFQCVFVETCMSYPYVYIFLYIEIFTYFQTIHRTYWIHPLKLTFLPLKMDGWNTIVSFWGPAHFQGRTVSFREGDPCKINMEPRNHPFRKEKIFQTSMIIVHVNLQGYTWVYLFRLNLECHVFMTAAGGGASSFRPQH